MGFFYRGFMFVYSNHWLDLKQKHIAIQQINKLLYKFVGRQIDSKSDLYIAMRKVVIRYFKDNMDKVKYFTHYDFEIEEVNGHITVAKFHLE